MLKAACTLTFLLEFIANLIESFSITCNQSDDIYNKKMTNLFKLNTITLNTITLNTTIKAIFNISVNSLVTGRNLIYLQEI